MIPLSRLAKAQLDALTAYYVERGRDEAADRLAERIERASSRIQSGQGLFFDAPRPYPGVARNGWRWTKEGPYWIAFARDARGPVIRAVFHDAADIPRRL